MPMISHAESFEDVILWRALTKVTNDFYLDVWARDSVQDTIMKPFYDQSWVGVNIQPHGENFVAQTLSLLGLDWKKHVVSDRKLFRPSDIERSSGNCAKARKKSGWKPQISFAQVNRLSVGTQAQRTDFKPLLGSL